MYVKHITILVITLGLAGFSIAQNTITEMLMVDWKLSRFGIDETYPAIVPGNVHTDLMTAGVIGDPFTGTNEDSVQWVGLEDWTYTSGSFTVADAILKKEHVTLVFNGLDTYANVWLNDQHILSANNYHRSWKVDVKAILKEEGNKLKVNFKSSVKIGEILATETDYELPGQEVRAVTRKPQFHYGWDWGPKLIGCGISAPIDIVGYDNLQLVSHDAVVKEHISDKTPVRFVFTVSAEKSFTGSYEIILGDSIKMKGQLNVKKGENSINHTLDKCPKSWLWWPIGQGEQKLHNLKLRITNNGKPALNFEDQIAIRRVDLITNKDQHGESFFFAINDEAVFCKGANYIPIDFFQNRVSHDDYDRVLEDVVDANMNMIRVWGGGIYEEEYFYDRCDELGILVWQDFMYACSMYPSQKYFLENAELEAIEQLQRLTHHPSIVLWCGNNENSEGWERWGWKNGLTPSQKRKVVKGYKSLFKKILPKAVRDQSALPYWESSPMLGRGDPEHQFRGDAHYWGVWHDAQPFDTLNYVVPRFMSEFGFQSFPEIETIRCYAGNTTLDRTNPAIISHEKHPRGFTLIDEYMMRDYGFIPEKFEDYVWLGQIQQAEGIGIGLDAHRRNAPYCMGTLYWQLNDCWPVASWSSLDYFGNWKPLHYESKKQFTPQKLSHFLDDEILSIYLISDEDIQSGAESNWQMDFMDFNGNVSDSLSGAKSLRNELSQLLWQGSVSEWKMKGKSHLIRLNMKFEDKNFTHVIDLVQPKSQQLTNANVQANSRLVRDGQVELSFVSENYVRNVWIEGSRRGKYSENNFDLVPGEMKVIFFTPEKSSETIPLFTFKTLNDLYITN